MVLAVGTLGVAGQSPAEFSLESESTVATPPQTISNQLTDGELTVRQTAVVEPDAALTGTATVPDPDNQTYVIQLVNSDQQIIDDTTTDEAETSYEFDAGPESPGSYAVSIWDPNEQLVKSVLPVVIASHDVSSIQINSSTPSNADVAPSETVPVAVSLTTLEATTVERVNLTVWNDDEELSTTLENTTTNEYEGTLPSLDEGEYQVQVRVRGGETVDGRPSLIGLSNAHSLTVSSTQESDGDSTDTGSSGDDSGDSGSPGGSTGGEDGTDDSNSTDGSNGTDDSNSTDGSNGTDDSNSTDSSNGTDDSNSTDSSNGTDDSDSTDGDSTNTNGTDTGANDSGSGSSSDATGNGSDETITPNDGSVSSGETDESTPLYAVQVLLLTVVCGGGLRRFRRAN
ncbi:hypothetical protein HPS36_03760 [Halorubrum salinarum]|uniref:Cell surface glycoprotein n=1 Tax=Halorubrum salinarum TaxID=2739057 RepID=A0A7D3XT71_9EURY|nr:hypothetical protein [Halorubrum salinarum]QKG92009.1 hypothetical protein HPS36_03760 [Halorubrum salinarum]